MRRFIFTLLIILIAALSVIVSAKQAPIGKTNRYLSEMGAVEGGESADGCDLRNIRWGKQPGFERVVLDIDQGAYQEKGLPVQVPCYFKIKYEFYPYRFTVLLSGIRARNAKYQQFTGSGLIQGTYLIPYLDDAGIMFAVALKKPVEYEIFEMHNPGRIVIDLRENRSPVKLPDIYSVRTKSGLGVENAGHLEESLMSIGSKNVRIIQAKDGGLFVEEGYYRNPKEAENRLKTVVKEIHEVPFFIEKRGPLSSPQ